MHFLAKTERILPRNDAPLTTLDVWFAPTFTELAHTKLIRYFKNRHKYIIYIYMIYYYVYLIWECPWCSAFVALLQCAAWVRFAPRYLRSVAMASQRAVSAPRRSKFRSHTPVTESTTELPTVTGPWHYDLCIN